MRRHERACTRGPVSLWTVHFFCVLQLFTALTSSQRCHSRVYCCCQGASSSSQISVVGSARGNPASLAGTGYLAPEALRREGLDQGPTVLSVQTEGSHCEETSAFSSKHSRGLSLLEEQRPIFSQHS